MSHSSDNIVFIDGLSFPLVDPPLHLELHRKRDDVVGFIFAMIVRSHDLFPTHGAFGDAFAGLGALIFACYEGFHETCVTEEVALERVGLVFVLDCV